MNVTSVPYTAPARAMGWIPRPSIHADPADRLDLGQFPPETKLVPSLAISRDVMQLSSPALHRPVLMIHGLAQQADTFVNLKNFFLTHPENGYGGTYHVDRDHEFLSDYQGGNVFAIDLKDNLASPEQCAAEVRKAIARILAVTGAREVDVITHSMGSLSMREAVRQGENRVANLVMLAPPNQGAFEATLACKVGWLGLYHHYPGDKMGAMEALRLERGPLGGVANEYLHGLNQDWSATRGGIKAHIITGTGLPTPDLALSGTSTGDGMVAARRAPLEGSELYLAAPLRLAPGDPNFRDFQEFRYNHLQIVSEPEIYSLVGRILTADAPAAGPEPERQMSFYFMEQPEPLPEPQLSLFP